MATVAVAVLFCCVVVFTITLFVELKQVSPILIGAARGGLFRLESWLLLGTNSRDDRRDF